jgi:hypothetical protein
MIHTQIVVTVLKFLITRAKYGQSQGPHGLSHRSTAARLL